LSSTSFAEAEIRPLRVGRKVWIGPIGTRPAEENGLIPVWLHAGPAFGTGAHPSTQLCLRILERHLPAGTALLDLGAGSAILAIAAAKLGADPVLALDIDEDAVHVARANVAANGVADRVHAEVGSLDTAFARDWAKGARVWVVTNILAHVIVEFFEQGLARSVGPGGWLILSGILRSQSLPILAWIHLAGLELLAQEQQGEWVCMVARRRIKAT
jgi:ribosomal protein L11 methyltransferase